MAVVWPATLTASPYRIPMWLSWPISCANVARKSHAEPHTQRRVSDERLSTHWRLRSLHMSAIIRFDGVRWKVTSANGPERKSADAQWLACHDNRWRPPVWRFSSDGAPHGASVYAAASVLARERRCHTHKTIGLLSQRRESCKNAMSDGRSIVRVADGFAVEMKYVLVCFVRCSSIYNIVLEFLWCMTANTFAQQSERST